MVFNQGQGAVVTKNNFASLSDIAKRLKVNKSKLTYYASLGILRSAKFEYAGRTGIYHVNTVIEIVKNVDKMSKKGLTLEQIAKQI